MSNIKRISYESTGSFSKLVIDYLDKDDKLKPFINDFPSIEAIKKQISRKEKQQVDRGALVQVLQEQYKQNDIDNPEVNSNIEKISSEKTFTICTAHQPNIFTGYLYTIYKIVHAINLARECAQQIPGYDFVPVFFIGSEDNDIEEIGTINFKSKKYQWRPNETGACGRFSTESLVDIRDQILALFGSSESEEKLKKQIISAYDGKRTLTQATQHFLNSLFGSEGLLILDADDSILKQNFKSIVNDELVNQTSNKLVIEHNKLLAEHYKIQVDPRELNLFYLKGNIRERIEKKVQKWSVINTEIEIKPELAETHPELFSPNVILRPLYQETILPNVAFVGGGSEIAYWCELKSLFDHYSLPFPILFVRKSASIVSEKIFKKIEKLGFEESFKPLENALKEKSLEHGAYVELLENLAKLQSDYKTTLASAKEINPSLAVSADAHLAKILKTHERIKTKYRSHIKREFEDLSNQKIEISDALFPDGQMQERNENYLELLSIWKMDIIPVLLNNLNPLDTSYYLISL